MLATPRARRAKQPDTNSDTSLSATEPNKGCDTPQRVRGTAVHGPRRPLWYQVGTNFAAASDRFEGWMGHRDYKTTEIYADFAPDPSQGAMWAELPSGRTRRHRRMAYRLGSAEDAKA